MISHAGHFINAAVVMAGSYRRRQPCYKQLLKKGVTPGNEMDIEKLKSSNTIFILGSGGSINEYTDYYWSEISQHDSLGFNWWMIHDFVPTFYGSEAFPNENFRKLLKKKKKEYQDVPFIWKEVKQIKRSPTKVDIGDIPNTIRQNLYTFLDIGIGGKTTREIRESYKLIHLLGLDDQGKSPKYIFEKRASLSYYIYLAMLWGYDNIVLCGVDLNDTGYFYLENEQKYRDKGLPIPKKQKDMSKSHNVHKTYDSSHGKATIDKVIKALYEELLKPKGIELYVGSQSSALYPEYKYYF